MIPVHTADIQPPAQEVAEQPEAAAPDVDQLKDKNEQMEKEQPDEERRSRVNVEEPEGKMDKAALKKDRKSLRQLFDEDGNLSQGSFKEVNYESDIRPQTPP